MTTPAPTPDPRPQTPDPAPADVWLTPARFALVLAALLTVTFWRVLFGGEALFYRDYGFLGYPFAHFHRECFWNGDFFPLWNPYVNCGAPFLAQWNTLCLYPGALIYLLLPLPWSLGFFCVVHLFLGGMGMRTLAERWTGSRFGAAVAGVAFVFSGLVLGCVIYPNYLVALGWMPWVVLATRRAWQEGGRAIVLAALAGAMQMLTGAPEIILLTWGLLAGLMLTEVFSFQFSVFSQDAKSTMPSGTPTAKTEHLILNTDYFPRRRFAPALRFGAVILFITGLCAAQLLPFFQLLSLSQRSGDAVNTFWSLPGWGWVNLFFPLFMNFQTEQGVFVMIGQSFFPSVYLGIVPLTLALLAVWRVRTPEVKLLGAATLLAVLLAMGDNFPLWGWLRALLPLGVVRFPVKALLLAAFTVPLLAAWGIAFVSNRAGSFDAASQLRDLHSDSHAASALFGQTQGARDIFKLMLLAAAVTMLKSGFVRAWPMPSDPKLTTMLMGPLALNIVALYLLLGQVFQSVSIVRRNTAVLILFVLMVVDLQVNTLFQISPTIPASAFQPGLAAAYHESKGALTPAPKLGESRIMLSPQAERALHTRMVPKFYDDFIGQRLAFWGNLNLLDGLPKVNGASTLVTREWNDVEYFLYGTTNPAPANLMDFLGVTHTTKPGELMQWERRTNAMPLVSLPSELTIVKSDLSLAGIQRVDWDPRVKVQTTDESSENEHFRPIKLTPSPVGSARIIRFSPTRIELEADAIGDRILVVSQSFYPCWKATVNDEPWPVVKANHAFQATRIPAGKSTIRLDYVDWPFRIGAGISLATLLGCVGLWRRARLH